MLSVRDQFHLRELWVLQNKCLPAFGIGYQEHSETTLSIEFRQQVASTRSTMDHHENESCVGGEHNGKQDDEEALARLEEFKTSMEAKMALRQSNLNPERPDNVGTVLDDDLMTLMSPDFRALLCAEGVLSYAEGERKIYIPNLLRIIGSIEWILLSSCFLGIEGLPLRLDRISGVVGEQVLSGQVVLLTFGEGAVSVRSMACPWKAICSLLHQRYKDFSPSLIQGLLKVFFPGKSGDDLDSDRNMKAVKKCSTLKLLLELYFVGIFEDISIFINIIKDLTGWDLFAELRPNMTCYSTIEKVNAALVELEEHKRNVSSDKTSIEKHSDAGKPPSRTSSNVISANGKGIANGVEENGEAHEDIEDSNTDSSGISDLIGDSEDDDDDGEDDDEDDGGGPPSVEDEVHVRSKVAEVVPQEAAEFDQELRALMQARPESMDSRKLELRSRPTLNMMIPMNVFEGSIRDHHGRSFDGESGDETLDEESGEAMREHKHWVGCQVGVAELQVEVAHGKEAAEEVLEHVIDIIIIPGVVAITAGEDNGHNKKINRYLQHWFPS
ncbi:Up-frameshift suppressor 2, C-terminal [Dillenia turbinata]|uniref:Up-frameshift suppressor 2, C-terminal n=1 Tax=Dillenia turbinata TaxID=194707 RepID=A0AAN8Z7B1_9MAGN